MSGEHKQYPLEPFKWYRISLTQVLEFIKTTRQGSSEQAIGKLMPDAWEAVLHDFRWMDETAAETDPPGNTPRVDYSTFGFLFETESEDSKRLVMNIRVESPHRSSGVHRWRMNDPATEQAEKPDGLVPPYGILILALRTVVQSMIQQGFATTPLAELSPEETEDMIGRLIKEVPL